MLPDDPRAWEAIGQRPDDDVVRSYGTVRTFLARWHRWSADWYPIHHDADATEVTMPDGTVVRAEGRIVDGDGRDITDTYLGGR